MNIYTSLVRHRNAIYFTVVVLILAGAGAMLRMPVSLFPDITFPRIVILADNGEQPADRMMTEVTIPLEQVASSLQDVALVHSVTSRGSTEISINLNWGVDVQQALQILQGSIEGIRNTLPATANIRTQQMRVSVYPIQGYSLGSKTRSQTELRNIALYQIRPALMQIKGVARVEVTGGDTREFLVTVSPERLALYHLSITQVSDAVGKGNVVSSTGLVNNNYQIYLSLVQQKITSIEDLRSIVIATNNNVPVLLSDIATVSSSVADRFIRTTAHGQDAVLLNIIKQPSGSTVQIGLDVDAAVGQLKLPTDVRFENFYDQADFINTSISSTRDSIVVGIVLAMFVLLIFLRNWRITLVIAVIVPSVILITLLILNTVGISINIMTLGGIAAAVGLIIDDSIVVIENIFSSFRLVNDKAETLREKYALAAQLALRELFPAIVASTASTLVIHIPLAFLGGLTGAFFASLSITMVCALIISFLLSISLAPLLTSSLVRLRDVEKEATHETRITWFQRWYERALRLLIRWRYAGIPVVIALGFGTYLLYQQVPSGFLPDMDEGSFVIDYTSPPGTSLDETNRMLIGVEAMLMKIPEVDTYSRRTGTQLGFFLTEPNTGDFLVKLKKERSRDIEAVIAEVRTKIEGSQPGLRVDFGQLMQDVIGDLSYSPSPIEIKIFGTDTRLLEAAARRVDSLIQSVPGVVDDFNGIVISGPTFLVTLDPQKTAIAGFQATDVAAQVSSAMQGDVGSQVLQGERLVDVRVRLSDAYRKNMDSIAGMKIVNSKGIAVPLSSIATVARTGGQTELVREGLRRMIAVTARLSDRDLGSTIADIKRKLAANFVLPKGMSLEYGGLYQSQQESFIGLLYVAIAAFGLVFIVLLLEFREFAAPLAIFIIDLLSMIGVIVALWVTGVAFNISSFVGAIMVIGIVAENAIFIMHETKRFHALGENLDTALINAVHLRRRPIIMTTLAAVLALLPLALGIGAGAQMQQPLAIAVIGGFSLSTLLLFFALPVVYRWFARR